MPRANRHFLSSHVWHITHRCHEREFLLRFARDRRFWRRRLYEARKRHGLCVLNSIATRNHVHLLVRDRGQGEIARSMQLIAGRTGQAYNRRKNRKGAFWEDRYHATAVETGEHLARCLVYIDANTPLIMLRMDKGLHQNCARSPCLQAWGGIARAKVGKIVVIVLHTLYNTFHGIPI